MLQSKHSRAEKDLLIQVVAYIYSTIKFSNYINALASGSVEPGNTISNTYYDANEDCFTMFFVCIQWWN